MLKVLRQLRLQYGIFIVLLGSFAAVQTATARVSSFNTIQKQRQHYSPVDEGILDEYDRGTISFGDGVSFLRICRGGSTRIGNDTTTRNGYRYTWFPSDDLSASNVPAPFFTARSSRLYVLKTENDKGAVTYDSIMIWVEDWVSPRFAPENDICEGTTSLYAITSNGIADSVLYRWIVSGTAGGKIIDGQYTNAINVLWDAAGDGRISIDMTSVHYGCSTTGMHDVQVQARPQPRIQTSGSPDICPGSAITLDAGDGYAWYKWSNGSNARSIVATQEGEYAVEVANANHCSSLSPPVVVRHRYVAAPTIYGQSKICGGETIQLFARTGYVSYLWSDGSTGARLDVHTPGTYSVQAIDSNGCSAESQPFTVSYYDLGVTYNSGFSYGRQEAHRTVTKEIEISNNANTDITIEGYSIIQSGSEFTAEGASVSLPYVLQPSEHIRVRVAFVAPQAGNYTADVRFRISQPCLQEHTIHLNAETYNLPLAIHTYIPQAIYDTGDSTATYPVYARIVAPEGEAVDNLNLQITMRWKARLFAPVSVSRGNIVSSHVEGEDRVIQIEVPSVHLQEGESVVTAIQGITLADMFFSSAVGIEDYQWSNVPREANYTKSDGSITLRPYCFPRNIETGLRLNSSLKVLPNPIRDKAVIKVETALTGNYELRVFSETGVQVWQQAFAGERDKIYEFPFDCLGLGNGIYPVVLYCPSKTINSLMIITR